MTPRIEGCPHRQSDPKPPKQLLLHTRTVIRDVEQFSVKSALWGKFNDECLAGELGRPASRQDGLKNLTTSSQAF
jgi:hypothetical protein